LINKRIDVTTSSSTTPTSSGLTTGPSQGYSVVGSDYQFTPSTLQINAGDTVTWTWTGIHNVAQAANGQTESYDGSGFRSGDPVSDGQVRDEHIVTND
jgi:plastocyanin